jgi:protein TonB
MIVAQQRRDPGKQFFGISVVILLHVLLTYALVSGLARKVVDVLKKPLEVNIVEELKALPPPPKNLPPPPKVVVPPPAFVPPPEVHVEAPPQQNAVVVTTAVAPPEPATVPVAKPVPPVVNVGAVCPNHLDVRNKVVFPAQALRLGLSGDVLVEFTVSASGAITNIGVVKSTNRVFNDAAIDAVGKFRCAGQGRDVRVTVPFNFRLEN